MSGFPNSAKKIVSVLAAVLLAGSMTLCLTGCDPTGSVSSSTSTSTSTGSGTLGWSSNDMISSTTGGTSTSSGSKNISTVPESDSKIMSYDSNMGVRTDDVAYAESEFLKKVQEVDGQIVSTDLDIDEKDGTGSANVVALIPNDKFIDVVNSVRELGSVYSENIDITVVGENVPSYYDDEDEAVNNKNNSSYNNKYDNSSYYNKKTTSELAVRFIDDTPEAFQFGELPIVFGQSLTALLYIICVLLPITILIVLIVVIVKLINKRRMKNMPELPPMPGMEMPPMPPTPPAGFDPFAGIPMNIPPTPTIPVPEQTATPAENISEDLADGFAEVRKTVANTPSQFSQPEVKIIPKDE